ncbi:MAG TPA: AAA family ATPase, partial [Enhygromyxa sp.]|nr:AAA family ATPase [Enhygromyxa sp.]
PGVRGVSLSNGGATRSSDVDMAHRLRMRTGAHDVEVPSTWLSHGYQATVSWLADLVGHILWERSENNLELTADPSKMEGLVLIDELDLHLHPSWQVGLIPALKQTFPRLQFVVTTHSEMLLAGLEGDEIVMLDQDPETGDITHHSDPRPAKLMTGTEMLGRYFGIDRLYPVNLSKEAHRYGYLAGDPYRTDEEQAELDELRRRLESAGVAPDWDPVPRKTS